MPKDAHPPAYWNAKLIQYAQGIKVFGKGKAPRKGTVYGEKLVLIKACPVQNNAGGKNMFGALLTCSCGFHRSMVYF